MHVLLSVKYILRYVYPGDYGEFIDYDEYSYCDDCEMGSDHIVGKPINQWNDPCMAEPKRDDNEVSGLVAKILATGIHTPLRLSLHRHRILRDGHHRFLAALDLGLDYVPVKLLNTKHATAAKIDNRFILAAA